MSYRYRVFEEVETMDICKEFDFEIDKIVKIVLEKKPRRILIQLPDGFRKCFNYISQAIENSIKESINIIFSLNPSYGPCLVDEHSARDVNADLIIHFGHTEYPLYKPSIDTVFIPVEYRGVDLEKIRNLINDICFQDNKICVTATAQHISLAKNLNKKECKIMFKGVALGCIPIDTNECDVLVVIAGGMFNCISQYLAAKNRNPKLNIFCLDPYNYRLWSPLKEIDRIIRVRLWKISKASEGRKWLIVTGFYGQSRDVLVEKLIRKAESRGISIDVAKIFKLDRNVIIDMLDSYDAIIVASCPYLAFDFYDIDIPVITIGEAFMILDGDYNRYVYPW